MQGLDSLKTELVETIRFLHGKGWAPATSSNYSFRAPDGENTFWISRSGVDKSSFTPGDLMHVDYHGKGIAEHAGLKPSAETLLHLLLYKNAQTLCVLHTHTVANTVLSLAHVHEGVIEFTGYELLKGLPGINTHEAHVSLPIFENSQDMVSLSQEIEKYWRVNQEMPGFLLAGHGLYTFGSTISEAKRHIEVLEFLFECTLNRKIYGSTQHP